MIDFATHLSDSELAGLAGALRAGRVRAPFTSVSLHQVVTSQYAGLVATGLESLQSLGATPQSIALMLDAMVADRQGRPLVDDVVDLVTTGPEASGVANRDTSVVVRELFANAVSDVLVVGYAVYQGQRVFAALADRMRECPSLQVRLFLDIQRSPTDTSIPAEIVRRFIDRFVTTQWPVDRPLPTAYYYPLSLESEWTKRSCLHAKCVVVDGEVAFVSSANFTEAAQEKNIEVGVLIRSESLAARITRHFGALVADGWVAPLELGHGR